MKRSPLRRNTPLKQGTGLRRSPMKPRTTPLRPVSRKRAKGKAAYLAWKRPRTAFGAECAFPYYAGEVGPVGHWGPLDIHHTYRGESGIVEEGHYAVLCRRHHDWIEQHPTEATRMGLQHSQYGP